MRLMKSNEKGAGLTVTHGPTERTERRKEGDKEENGLIEKIVLSLLISLQTPVLSRTHVHLAEESAGAKTRRRTVQIRLLNRALAELVSQSLTRKKTKISKGTNRLTPSALNSYLWLRVQESGGNYVVG